METIDFTNLQNTEVALEGLSAVAAQARKELGILDDHLLTLRLNFGKLRAAIQRAFAPITAAAAPVLNSAIRALTDFCDAAGSVMAALFGTVYRKAVTTTKATGTAVRRSLASFDKLERLQGSGGSGSSTTVELLPVNDELTPGLQRIVDTIRAAMARIQSLFAPLKTIDFTPAAEAFQRLGSVIASFGTAVLLSLERAWHSLLVPLSTWVVEKFVPASVDALTAAFTTLQTVFAPVKEGFATLQRALTPVAQFLGDTVLAAITGIQSQFLGLTQVFSDNAPVITAIFQNISQLITALWNGAQPVLVSLRDFFGQVLSAMGSAVSGFTAGALTAFQGLTDFLAGVFTGSWSRAWEGLKTVLKGAVNGIIALINSLLSGFAAGINAVITALNSISVTVPSWVPVLGGKHFGFDIPPISAPQIPYLAQGAVLPANKPFLAVVGDQRHGTNIEAPLATIQQAVALAMEDMAQGNLAGHEATVTVLRQILEAVLGISIGDDTVAAAYDRSHSCRAVMKGATYAL